MTPQSPFQTTRLPDLPPTQRLVIAGRSWLTWLRRIYPGILIGVGLSLFIASLAALAWPRPAAATLLPAGERAALSQEGRAPTPPIVVPAVPPPPAAVVTAAWAPYGQTYGTLIVEGPVELVEQYQGWARFRTAHMAGDLWAPIAQLAPVLDAAQLAAAPEIAPTPAPTAPAPPRPQPAPAAPVVVAAPPAPVELQPVGPEGGEVVVEDSPERLHIVYVQPADATPVPTAYVAPGNRTGGGWDD